ncbi:hypothetical protein B0H63DRAFT_385263 [Podospora didyma]|uniref:F-box domain-containing protein n=1 Tax=Podospora didyma TaxID=330526 RepID=A0AAE0U8W6_9PEZI|nr:hypothetical protein B0H63DRAFT_385263 [Podospora didyma]
MIEIILSPPASPQGLGPVFSREDHNAKEMSLRRGGKQAPRRSQTHQDYQLPQSPLVNIYTLEQHSRPTDDVSRSFIPRPTAENDLQEPKQVQPTRRRPALGPPRRSYSVTDREPVPHHHRPSAGMTLTLLDMPPELHYAIFDFLDRIDSTCLALTNKHFYQIHRRMHGTVPLSARRDGPNELEWAWHLAGNVMRASSSLSAAAAASGPLGGKESTNALVKLRVRGQAYCRKCGVTRCELHKHIQEWMGNDAEYCCVKQKFGTAALPGAKPYCYMSKPGDPSRCGRHWVRKNKVVLK